MLQMKYYILARSFMFDVESNRICTFLYTYPIKPKFDFTDILLLTTTYLLYVAYVLYYGTCIFDLTVKATCILLE